MTSILHLAGNRLCRPAVLREGRCRRLRGYDEDDTDEHAARTCALAARTLNRRIRRRQEPLPQNPNILRIVAPSCLGFLERRCSCGRRHQVPAPRGRSTRRREVHRVGGAWEGRVVLLSDDQSLPRHEREIQSGHEPRRSGDDRRDGVDQAHGGRLQAGGVVIAVGAHEL